MATGPNAVSALSMLAARLAAVTFDLLLADCQVTDLDFPDTPNRRRIVPLENLIFSDIVAPEFSDLSSDELLRLAEAAREDAGKEFTDSLNELRYEVDSLQREITGRLLKRYAVSKTAMLLMTLGATLAMWLRDSVPLTIYLWAFLPSIVDLIMISGGEHLLRQGNIAGGVIVMWSGNAVLLIIIAAAYQRLSRH